MVCQNLRSSGAPRPRPGFTLLELLIVVAVIAILAGLLLPAIAKAKRKAIQTQCLNNYKQMGLAIQMYADDNEGYLPGPVFAAGYVSYDSSAGSTKHLVNKIATYLGYPLPASQPTIVSIMHCPAHQRFLDGARPVGVRCFLLNDNVAPNPPPKVFPFGYPIASPDYPEPQPPLTITAVAQLAAPDSIWAASDGDWEILPNINNFDWARDFPVNPLHGTVRNRLFFDWHVEAVRR